MKPLFFYAFIWLASSVSKASGNTNVSLMQTFSKPHAAKPVTKTAPVRLKEIDVLNPIFVFK